MKPKTKPPELLLKNVDPITRFPHIKPPLSISDIARKHGKPEPKTVTVRIDGVWG